MHPLRRLISLVKGDIAESKEFRDFYPDLLTNVGVASDTVIAVLTDLSNLPYSDRIVVFGSVARGDMADDSDVDMFIDWRKNTAPPGLLTLCASHYGSLDAFFTTAPGPIVDQRRVPSKLVVRNDNASGWIIAQKANAIRAKIKTEGVSLKAVLNRLSLIK